MNHGIDANTHLTGFKDRKFSPGELDLVREVVASCAGLSRKELAQTICELLEWKRPSGRLKWKECSQWLERLESAAVLVLPEKQSRRPVGSPTRVPVSARGEARADLVGEVGEFSPIGIERVQQAEQRELFRELVGRHHYLGHAVPFGAHLRYLVYASGPQPAVLGCLQFSSPAWRMAVRDAWIGWDEPARRRNLQRVVNQSRFLILPWVHIQNLASLVLSAAARQLPIDWYHGYRVEILLVETLVDPRRYRGTCYRAANWIPLGETAGRGRMDRLHRLHGSAPKRVLVYPLVPDAARRLREE